jgi:NADP oxidoreductase coenzyme F420-dependent
MSTQRQLRTSNFKRDIVSRKLQRSICSKVCVYSLSVHHEQNFFILDQVHCSHVFVQRFQPMLFPIMSQTLRRCRLSATLKMSARLFSETTQPSMKLCVLGGGNMAEAIISALSKCKTQNMSDIVVFDINDNRIQHLTSTYGIRSCLTITEGMSGADVTLLSVKPQNVESIASSIPDRPRGLILSIVAGCTIDQLKAVFKTNHIVRSMPNTPAMVMEAMTVWVATEETPQDLVGN